MAYELPIQIIKSIQDKNQDTTKALTSPEDWVRVMKFNFYWCPGARGDER